MATVTTEVKYKGKHTAQARHHGDTGARLLHSAHTAVCRLTILAEPQVHANELVCVIDASLWRGVA